MTVYISIVQLMWAWPTPRKVFTLHVLNNWIGLMLLDLIVRIFSHSILLLIHESKECTWAWRMISQPSIILWNMHHSGKVIKQHYYLFVVSFNLPGTCNLYTKKNNRLIFTIYYGHDMLDFQVFVGTSLASSSYYIVVFEWVMHSLIPSCVLLELS